MGGALLSILSGGATGLLGVAFQRFFDWLNVKANLQRDRQKFEFDLAMRDKDRAMLDAEWAGRLRVAYRESAAAEDVAKSKAFEASLFKEPERYAEGPAPKNWMGSTGWFMLAMTDVFRGIVRPALTLYLCVLVTAIWLQAKKLTNKEDLTPDQALILIGGLVDTILYVWTTCTLWWFGTRNAQQPPKQPR